jgi:hypothetical protein
MFWDFIWFSKIQNIKSWRTFSNSIIENSIEIKNQTFKEIEGVFLVALEGPFQCTKVV